MSEQDRTKWNRKYHDKPTLLEERPPSKLVERYFENAPGKKALDLACGSGRHTLFLAKKDFEVDAADISSVALAALGKKSTGLKVNLMEIDLDTFTPDTKRYDLVIKCNYLDRALISRTARGLKSGALFIIETYMQHPENEKKDSNPDYLLQPGELKQYFENDFDILVYDEFWNEDYELYRMKKQGIVAQKR